MTGRRAGLHSPKTNRKTSAGGCAVDRRGDPHQYGAGAALVRCGDPDVGSSSDLHGRVTQRGAAHHELVPTSTPAEPSTVIEVDGETVTLIRQGQGPVDGILDG